MKVSRHSIWGTTPTLALALALALLSTLTPLPAQTFYFGAVDDVYPVGLEVEAHGAARVWIGAVRRATRLGGACDSLGFCEWRGLDTALSLRGSLADDGFEGVLRDGAGHERRVLAKAYDDERTPLEITAPAAVLRPRAPKEWVDFAVARLRNNGEGEAAPVRSVDAFPADFLSYCGTDKTVSTWSTAAREYRLTLARLPGGRLAGSLYLLNSETTLLADGETDGERLGVQLRRVDGSPAGSIAGVVDSAADRSGEAWGRLSAKLDLDGQLLDLRLALGERIPMVCRQQGGNLDLLLPLVGEASPPSKALVNFDPMTPVDLVNDRWARLVASKRQGNVWFEPVRLDTRVLSGWVHEVTARGHHTSALNIDLAAGTLIGPKRFVAGPKRERNKVASKRFRMAVATHPLHDDRGFKTWVNGHPLSEVAIAAEGLVYATERHPVYGQLTWIEPWAELSAGLQASTQDLRGDGYADRPQSN